MPDRIIRRDESMRNKIFEIRSEPVDLRSFIDVCMDDAVKLKVSDEVAEKIAASRALLESLVRDERVIYGVNTGMGGFVDVLIPAELAGPLQNNLLNAMATNVGEHFDDRTVRAVMLARIVSLSKGVSAIGLDNFRIYVEMFNRNIYPLIPQKGSLGASGDLGPLACIALAATGQWQVRVGGLIKTSKEALAEAGIQPMTLESKEGLALINGTSAMTAVAALNWFQADRLLSLYDFISALSFEGLETKSGPFDPRAHKWKKHAGQARVADRISRICASSRQIMRDSDEEARIRTQNDGTVKSAGRQIEDAYSLRCTPQILGPVKDTLDFIETIVANELNSASDNPLVVPEEKDVFHNGHFHGQYIAMAMDYLSLSLTTLSNLSDRRIDRFMDKNNSNGLPPFLAGDNPGVRFGLMGGQFMATSLTAENRSLCTPLSIQTLTSTGDFQDIVSFGLIAARRAREILDNAAYIVSFELLCACQAVDIRNGREKLSVLTRELYSKVREIIPCQRNDVVLTPQLEKMKELVKDTRFCDALDEKLSALP
jgi:histidine ammonia-lyase